MNICFWTICLEPNIYIYLCETWDRVDLCIPKLENPPVEKGNEEEKGPDCEVDKDTCGCPDRLTQLQTTRERKNGKKVFQVKPEETCKAEGSHPFTKEQFCNIV